MYLKYQFILFIIADIKLFRTVTLCDPLWIKITANLWSNSRFYFSLHWYSYRYAYWGNYWRWKMPFFFHHGIFYIFYSVSINHRSRFHADYFAGYASNSNATDAVNCWLVFCCSQYLKYSCSKVFVNIFGISFSIYLRMRIIK